MVNSPKLSSIDIDNYYNLMHNERYSYFFNVNSKHEQTNAQNGHIIGDCVWWPFYF